jgi:CRISPR-associated endonuclease Cas1
MLKNLEDDSHVKTRICQYESLKNGKALYLAKQFVLGKLEAQNLLLNKYGLQTNDVLGRIVDSVRESDLKMLRKRLLNIEGRYAEHYFKEIFSLFPESVRPLNRKGFKAYDGLNIIFNLSYALLFWKCYRALIKAHLEPYLGFLHASPPCDPEQPSALTPEKHPQDSVVVCVH